MNNNKVVESKSNSHQNPSKEKKKKGTWRKSASQYHSCVKTLSWLQSLALPLSANLLSLRCSSFERPDNKGLRGIASLHRFMLCYGFMPEFSLALRIKERHKPREYLLSFVNPTSILLINSGQECKSNDYCDSHRKQLAYKRLFLCLLLSD